MRTKKVNVIDLDDKFLVGMISQHIHNKNNRVKQFCSKIVNQLATKVYLKNYGK